MAMLVCLPAPAGARTLETVLQDDAQLLHRPEGQIRRSLEEMRLLGIDRIRVTAGWSVLTRDPDAAQRPQFDPTDPAAYEQERWRNLDRLLILANEYGFRTMVDIAFWAPKWASADGASDRGRTNVEPGHFRDFATAVARRYSGSFIIPRHDVAAGRPIVRGSDEAFLADQYGSTNAPAAGPSLHDIFAVPFRDAGDGDAVEESLGENGRIATRALPRVDVFTLWNEPNHTGFLRPQWHKVQGHWRPRSPHIYRDMVTLAYPAVKAVRPESTVLVGGTAFNGAYARKGTGGVPPLRFLRELACVDGKFKPLRRDGCRAFKGIPGDGWAHHPYSLYTAPGALNRPTRYDDVPVAELPKLADTLERLVRRGRISPGLRNIWVTEYGYETNPPVSTHKYSTGDQAQFLPWAEYLAWKVPQVQSFAQFLLRDLPPGAFKIGTSKARAFGQWQSGLLFEKGEPKLAVRSFVAGLVVERVSAGRQRYWIRTRIGGGRRQMVIEAKSAGSRRWSTVRTVGIGGRGTEPSFPAEANGVTQRFGGHQGQLSRRYRLRWFDGRAWHSTPPVRAIDALR